MTDRVRALLDEVRPRWGDATRTDTRARIRAVDEAVAALRDDPAALVELTRETFRRCRSPRFVVPVFGWLPAGPLDQLAEEARQHLHEHAGCEAAASFLGRDALRRPADDPPPALHLSYPESLLRHWQDGSPLRTGHATCVPRGTAPAVAQAVVGGVAPGDCPTCGGRVDRLLRLPNDPVRDVVGSRSMVAFACCWVCTPVADATFSAVDTDGEAHVLPTDRLVDPPQQDPVPPFPATEVELVDLGPAWRRQDEGYGLGLENLDRVGGEPTWVQEELHPPCPRCGEPTAFVGQLATRELWRVEGIAFLLWCDRCAVSAVVHQWS